jgi:hypothetical protein
MRSLSVVSLGFRCPVSERSASVAFLTAGGAEPSAIAACSLYPGDRLRCEQACLGLVRATWGPPPAVAALLERRLGHR